jgi:transposase
MEYLNQELKKKGVTLQFLWNEYKQGNPDGYQYSQFCRLYQDKRSMLAFDPSLRRTSRSNG